MGGEIYKEALDDIELQMFSSTEVRGEIREQVDKTAARGAAYAQNISPVGVDRDAAPGTFKNSIVSKQIGDKNGLPAAQIYSDAVEPDGHHYSQYVEYGSRGHSGHGTFGATQSYMQKQVS